MHHRRRAVNPDLPSIIAVRPLLDINRLQAILNIVMLVCEPALKLSTGNQEIVGENAVERRGISPPPSVQPLVRQPSDLLFSLIISISHHYTSQGERRDSPQGSNLTPGISAARGSLRIKRLAYLRVRCMPFLDAGSLIVQEPSSGLLSRASASNLR
jgi:hypothetical protein